MRGSGTGVAWHSKDAYIDHVCQLFGRVQLAVVAQPFLQLRVLDIVRTDEILDVLRVDFDSGHLLNFREVPTQRTVR